MHISKKRVRQIYKATVKTQISLTLKKERERDREKEGERERGRTKEQSVGPQAPPLRRDCPCEILLLGLQPPSGGGDLLRSTYCN